MKSDLKHLKDKIDAGADYIVTQMFFDNEKYFEFVKRCREFDINVPIIPGLKVLTTRNQSSLLPKVFNIDIPEAFLDEIEKCKNDKEVKEVGIAWCIQQSKELHKHKVPVLHYYTMGTSDSTKRVAEKVF